MGRALRVGDQVELRVAFNRSWSGGFEIVAVVDGGFHIRRHSDGRLLPGSTGPLDLRAVDTDRPST